MFSRGRKRQHVIEYLVKDVTWMDLTWMSTQGQSLDLLVSEQGAYVSLADLGKQGWELIQVVVPQPGTSEPCIAILKRPCE